MARFTLCLKINGGGITLNAMEHFGQQRRLAQMTLGFPDQKRPVTFACRSVDQVAVNICNQTNRPNRGGGQDRAAIGFIVKADIARNDGGVEG